MCNSTFPYTNAVRAHAAITKMLGNHASILCDSTSEDVVQYQMCTIARTTCPITDHESTLLHDWLAGWLNDASSYF